MRAEHAERLALLLARGGQFALELERLSNLGIWILTRADESYPSVAAASVSAVQAPPLLFGAGPASSTRR